MRFYEFEAKQLLEKHRIPLVESRLVKTADEAAKAASEIGGPIILKAQAIAPGLAASSVKEASDAGGAKAAASELFGIDDGGRKPKGLLVEARPAGEAVYSLSFTYDGTQQASGGGRRRHGWQDRRPRRQPSRPHRTPALFGPLSVLRLHCERARPVARASEATTSSK